MVALRTATAEATTLVVRDAIEYFILNRTLNLAAGTTPLPLAELRPLSSGVYVLRLSQSAQLKLVRE